MGNKKILITGSTGLLGSCLLENLDYSEIEGFSRSELDILNRSQINDKLFKVKPEIIIHTAAYTDVDGCELNQDKAFRVNVLGTQNLVNYCVENKVSFIYISSTGIYGNYKNTCYSEFDPIRPTTIHHISKYEGEKVVRDHINNHLILRTGWLYGGSKAHSKNFVFKRYLETQKKEVLFSDNTQFGNPTYVNDLVSQIDLLIKEKVYGTFNCVNEANNISRYDYVKKIIELLNVDCTVEIAKKGTFNRVAPVSHNESAVNYKLNLLGLNIMGDWVKSLSDYIKSLNIQPQ